MVKASAPKSGKVWTKADVAKLASLARKGLRVAQAATVLGRTRSATQQQASLSGVSFRQGAGRPKTKKVAHQAHRRHR